jgi:hypothetical protein
VGAEAPPLDRSPQSGREPESTTFEMLTVYATTSLNIILNSYGEYRGWQGHNTGAAGN